MLILHGHDVGFRFFIAVLKSLKFSRHYIIWYKLPDFRTEKLYTFCTGENGINWGNMKTRSLSNFVRGLIPDTKNFIHNVRFLLLRTLNISIPSFWIFWWWMETDSSLSSNSSKLGFLLLWVIWRHLLCNRFILWFRARLEHIQITGE